jgi:hypothetical protein
MNALSPSSANRSARAPAGNLIYAIGDIQGRSDLLKILLRKITADASFRLGSKRTIVYLGTKLIVDMIQRALSILFSTDRRSALIRYA